MSLTFDICYEEFYCGIAHMINKRQPLLCDVWTNFFHSFITKHLHQNLHAMICLKQDNVQKSFNRL